MVSENCGVDVADFADSGNRLECLFELSADLFVSVIDHKENDDLLESECDGLDVGLLDLDTCGNDLAERLAYTVEGDLCALGPEVVW